LHRATYIEWDVLFSFCLFVFILSTHSKQLRSCNILRRAVHTTVSLATSSSIYRHDLIGSSLSQTVSRKRPHHTHTSARSLGLLISLSKFRKRNSPSQQSPQTKQTTNNNGLDPLQPPQRNSLPLLKINIQHPQPSKLLHSSPCTNNNSFPPRREKTQHIHPLILNLQQQQQQQRRNFHLLLHQHLNPDFWNLLATRLCARPSSARLLLQ
jgi:hypothetical protein